MLLAVGSMVGPKSQGSEKLQATILPGAAVPGAVSALVRQRDEDPLFWAMCYLRRLGRVALGAMLVSLVTFVIFGSSYSVSLWSLPHPFFLPGLSHQFIKVSHDDKSCHSLKLVVIVA